MQPPTLMSLDGPSSVPLGFGWELAVALVFVVGVAEAVGFAEAFFFAFAFAVALGDALLSGVGVEPVSAPDGGAAVLSEDEPPQPASTPIAPSVSAPRSTVRRWVVAGGVRSSSCSG